MHAAKDWTQCESPESVVNMHFKDRYSETKKKLYGLRHNKITLTCIIPYIFAFFTLVIVERTPF